MTMSPVAESRRPLATTTTTVDYCTMETLNLTCTSEDQVLVVRRARYGRMSLGRCVHSSFGYLGCAVNVRGYLDLICSGRRNCTMPVPDNVLHATRPCHGDLTSYLQLTYDCVTGRSAVLSASLLRTSIIFPDQLSPTSVWRHLQFFSTTRGCCLKELSAMGVSQCAP